MKTKNQVKVTDGKLMHNADRPNPEEGAGLVSELTAWWMNRLFLLAYKQPLQTKDIYGILPRERAGQQGDKLERLWESLSVEKKQTKYSLLKCLFRCVTGTLSMAITCTFLSEILKFIQPVFIGILVEYFIGDSRISREVAYGCGCGLIMASLVYDILFTTSIFLYQLTAMRMRTACTAILYRKVLRISNLALSEQNIGYLMNLLATDIEKFHMALSTLQGVVFGPFVLVALSLILGFEVGYSVVPGTIFILIMLSLRLAMGKAIGRLRSVIAGWTDKRLTLLTEIIRAIRMIKMHGWETPLSVRIAAYRRKEMRAILNQMLHIGVSLFFGYVGPKVTTFAIIATYTLLGNTLTAQVAVQVVTWIHASEFLLFIMFPHGVGNLYQMVISVRRIQSFLLSEEKPGRSSVIFPSQTDNPSKPRVVLKDAGATWWSENVDTSSNTPTETEGPVDMVDYSGQFYLSNISFTAEKDDLVTVLGSVGSGKSSLLLTILGDLPLTCGERHVEGSMAYVPHEAWMIAGTVEDNILMGNVKDSKRYNHVIRACDLQQDLRSMTSGDQTIIGERGLTLSESQRAKINLARAVYFDADIYILDDPFSCLDPHVGNKLFRNVICDLLDTKLRIMVTQQTKYVKRATKAVILENGRMLASGSDDVSERSLQRALSVERPLRHSLKQLSRMNSWESFRTSLSRKASYCSVTDVYIPEILEEGAFGDVVASAGEEIDRAVSPSLFSQYFRAGNGVLLLPLILIIGVVYETAGIFTEWWTTEWYYRHPKKAYSYFDYYNLSSTSNISTNQSYALEVSTVLDVTSLVTSNRSDDVLFDVYVYAGVLAVHVVGCLAQGVILSLMVWFAARNIYKGLFKTVINLRICFFERTPLGRILNRFSRYTAHVDESLLLPVYGTFELGVRVLGKLVYTCVVKPWAVLATVPFIFGAWLLRRFSAYAIRDIKRIDGKTRTPIFSHMSAILDGLTVIRAFQLEEYILSKANQYIDTHTSTWYLYLCAHHWLHLRLMWLSTLYFAVIIFLAISLPGETAKGGALGLSLTYISILITYTKEYVGQTIDFESYMTSFERIYRYSLLDVEEQTGPLTVRYPLGWPTSGDISLQDVSLQYEGLKVFALRNLTFHVSPREKVGIVGRTGAGKSSLFTALLRLVEPGGRITIDGIDIKEVGLSKLRSVISVVLKDPVLLSGVLRDNLDPHGHRTDEAIWDALEHVQMKETVQQLPGALDHPIAEGGANFSVGQRQLLSMARALLENNKIILIDEATTNVDDRTDTLIQRALRDEFADCTVLHVTQRLHTIIQYNRIMVLHQGNIIGLDHPHVLLQNKGGVFYQMIKQTGPVEAARLMALASSTFSSESLEGN